MRQFEAEILTRLGCLLWKKHFADWPHSYSTERSSEKPRRCMRLELHNLMLN